MNPQWPHGIDYLRIVKGFTWTPYSGCLHACPWDCWAERGALKQARNPKSLYAEHGFKPHFYPERLQEPLRRKKPTLIAGAFMGDLFGDWVPAHVINQILEICRQAEWHRFLLLTKNPRRFGAFQIPPNCWAGTSVTGGIYQSLQIECKRIEALVRCAPEGRRYLSLEPYGGIYNASARRVVESWIANVNWVIVGGRSGEGACGSSNVELGILALYCRREGVPFFIKGNAKSSRDIQEIPEELKPLQKPSDSLSIC